MIIITSSKHFCEQIAMDTVGPTATNGNRFILTLQDDLTKFIQAYAMPEHSAESVAIHFLKFCTQYGFSDNISNIRYIGSIYLYSQAIQLSFHYLWKN